MTTTQINTEMKKVKNVMDSLMNCVKDMTIPAIERKQYYKEYLEASVYYLKLNQSKPKHNLSIA